MVARPYGDEALLGAAAAFEAAHPRPTFTAEGAGATRTAAARYGYVDQLLLSGVCSAAGTRLVGCVGGWVERCCLQLMGVANRQRHDSNWH